MKIRKATKNDLNEIGKLMLREFSKKPFNEKDSLKDVLKSLNSYFQNAEIYISETEKEITGVIVFKVEQWWEGPVIIIQDLAVKEKFQRQNIGKELMILVEEYAKNKRAKRIYFGTNKKSSAVKFHKKMGYKIDKDRINMSKRLK
jgi:N-acetylglutamate synthase-like GNAT family acetyltransferase